MMTEIKKGEVEKLKKWIINYISSREDFGYFNLSVYEDYDYVDSVVFSVLKDFDDFVQGISNGLCFETVSTDTNDKIVKSDVYVYTFSEVKHVLGRKGYILFCKFDNKDAQWHSILKFFDSEDELLKRRDFWIKTEMAGIDNIIKDLNEVKEKIQNLIEN